MANRDNITSGPIPKTIISLAIPVMLGMFMEFAFAVTDFFWVGKLGPAAQDAITTSMVVIWSVFASFSLISIGLTALVSRSIGARKVDDARFFTQQGLALAIIVAVVVTIGGLLATPVLVRFMEAGPTTAGMAVPYLRIFFISTLFFALAETSYATFRASGDTVTPTLIGVSAVAANMILDPLLIFGIGPLPALGVTGAGVASGISILMAAVAVLTLLFRGKVGFKPGNPLRSIPHFATLGRISRIGLPMSCHQFVFILVYWFLIKIVHQFGEAAGAAMGIGNRMESFSYLLAYGISLAASTMTGQNLGAGNPDRAAQCAWGAVGIGTGITIVVSLLFISIPEIIAGIFSDDEAVIRIAVDYLIILGISQVTMAVEIVLEGAFSGAGDTVPPMLVGIIGSAARVPLAYMLAISLGWGINGVWWTLTITTIAKALVLGYWFRLGRWKHRAI